MARARLEGVARDAKLGAALETADRGVVYLEGRAAWPPDLVGRRVVVEGELALVDDALAARVDPDGAVSQGTAGGDLVLRAATIRRA